MMAHVTIMTAKMDESIEFYQKIVGLKIIRDLRAGAGDHAVIFLAEEAGQTCVELCSEPGAAFTGSGISMGFPVPDVEAKKAELEAMGIPCGPMISPNPHVTFFFVKDPNGVGIQFLTEK